MSMPPRPLAVTLAMLAFRSVAVFAGETPPGAAAFFHFAITPVLIDHGDGRGRLARFDGVSTYQISRLPERSLAALD